MKTILVVDDEPKIVQLARDYLERAGFAVRTAPDGKSALAMLELAPARIREVLENLLANAPRHTPQHGTIGVTAQTTNGDRRRAAVSVCDTGTGIPSEDLPHIFGRFYKSRESRGTGLGLAIARNLVAAHGGEISAASELGKGTKILFTLPLAA
jgi:signal transduction histidine kinase